MPAMEILVMLCSIMVIDTLISGMRTSIASRSGLAGERLGTGSSRLNQKSGHLEFGNCLRGMAIVAVICFTDRTV